MFVIVSITPVAAQPTLQTSQESIDLVIFIEQTERLYLNFDRFGRARYEAVQNLIDYASDLYVNFIDPATDGAINLRIAVVNINDNALAVPNSPSTDGSSSWFDFGQYINHADELETDLEAWFTSIEGCFQAMNCVDDYSDFYAAEQYAFQELLPDTNPARHLVFMYMSEGWTCPSASNCQLNDSLAHRNRMTALREQRDEFDSNYDDISVYLLGMGSALSATQTALTENGRFEVREMDAGTTPDYDLMQNHLFPTALGMFVDAIETPLANHGLTRYSIDNSGLIDDAQRNFQLPVQSLEQSLYIVNAYSTNSNSVRFNVLPQCDYPPENDTVDLNTNYVHVMTVANPCGGTWSIRPSVTLRDYNLMENDSVFVGSEQTEWSTYVVPKILLQSNQPLNQVIDSLSSTPVQDTYQYEEVLLLAKVAPQNAYITNGTHTISAEVCVIAPGGRHCNPYPLVDLAPAYSTPIGEYWGVEIPIHSGGRHDVTFAMHVNGNSSPINRQFNFDSVLMRATTQGLQCTQAVGGNPNDGRPGAEWRAWLALEPERQLSRQYPSTLPVSFEWNAVTISGVTGVTTPIDFNQDMDSNMLRFQGEGQLPNEPRMSVEVSPLFQGQVTALETLDCRFTIDLVTAEIPNNEVRVIAGQPLQVTIAFPSNDAAWLAITNEAILEVQVEYQDRSEVLQTWTTTYRNLRNYIHDFQGQPSGYFDLDLSDLDILSDVITIRYRILLSREGGITFPLFPLETDADGWQSSQVQLRR